MESIGRALWYIESHHTGAITLDEVAAASGLSRFQLSRGFGYVVGQPVTAYLRRRRLTESARRLADGAADILSVAFDAGYGSHEAFTRAFRDQFGLTPDELRARRCLDGMTLQEPIRMTDLKTPAVADPRFETRQAITVAGLADFFRYEDTAGIPQHWQRFGLHIGHVPGEIGGAAYGVCWSDPMRKDGFNYMAGVAVRDRDFEDPELTAVTVPAGRWAAFWHGGHVSQVQATCAAIFGAWLSASGLAVRDGAVTMVEYYDGRFDPRTGEGGLEIWIPLED